MVACLLNAGLDDCALVTQPLLSPAQRRKIETAQIAELDALP